MTRTKDKDKLQGQMTRTNDKDSDSDSDTLSSREIFKNPIAKFNKLCIRLTAMHRKSRRSLADVPEEGL